MSNPLRYSDFAKAIQCQRASITMAVKVGTLIPVEGKKEIDPDNPTNQAWISKQEMKGKNFDINLIYKPAPQIIQSEQQAQTIQVDTDNDKPKKKVITLDDIRKIELKQKLANLKKTEREVKLNDLKIQKMQGLSIPTDAAKDVFMFSESTIITTFKQNLKNLLDIIQNKSGMSHNDYIELDKELNEHIDIIHNVAKNNILKGLEGVISEYQEIRGRGEKK